jgi:hypothetical protein
MTFGDGLALFRERQKHATDIKNTTKAYAVGTRDRSGFFHGGNRPALKIFIKNDCHEQRV